MNFNEIEKWVRNSLIKNSNISLNSFLKREKIFEALYNDNEVLIIQDLDSVLKRIGKNLNKIKSQESVYWFKINLIDNAIPDLVGLGKIDCFTDLNIISNLLIFDKASQNGDVCIGLFDHTKKWLIKITNDQDNKKIYIRLYGQAKIIDVLI